MRYRELEKGVTLPQLEREVLDFWKETDIFHKSMQVREGKPRWVFFEGPPTANGRPGIHHVITRTIKDLICRYRTMKGYYVPRKAGWDTHGLPVEIEVEKQLGLESKTDIERYGVDKFNAKCRASVFSYKDDWDRLTERMGYWLDLDNAYMTCTNEYIESVWWLLAQYFERDLIYEGHKVLPYCPRCGTGLSDHEEAQGYKEVEDPSVYVRFRVKGEEGRSFLVWTTTPWTLLSNAALAVGAGFTYVEVERRGERLILVKDRLSAIFPQGDYTVQREFLGAELREMTYEPLYSYMPFKEKAHYVIVADFVTIEDGTGIVHIAPGYGKEDYGEGRKFGLPTIQAVEADGHVHADVTPWAGTWFKDVDPIIIADLKARGLLYEVQKIKHAYSHCWRCETPLIQFARKSWYIRTTAYRDKLLEANAKINWFPPEIGSGRFGEWLENNIDWALSRERYWGTPLPIWVCPDCGKKVCPDSVAKLRSLAVSCPEELDLHKPYVDDIVLRCPDCGGGMRRVPDVIDCWFDAGAMPFAQWHYPFENAEAFERGDLYPADFISEAIDQTRGWFYTLLAISVFITGKSSYKTCIVCNHIQDKSGKKMSKKLGNVVNPFEAMELAGADAVRWYLLAVSQPWLPTKYDPEGVLEVARKFLDTLKNTYSFFALYANLDDFAPDRADIPPVALRSLMDRWVLSRLQAVVEGVEAGLAEYRLTTVARIISDYTMDDVSNWYVRLSRSRFWAGGMDHDKLSAFATLHTVLTTLTKLMAPYAPFLSETIYRELVSKNVPGAEESVHLAAWPENVAPRDEVLEREMDAAMRITVLARKSRTDAKLKVRQPLARLTVQAKGEAIRLGTEVTDLVLEEINVKELLWIDDATALSTPVVTANLRLLGPRFGAKAGAVNAVVKTLPEAKVAEFVRDGKVSFDVEGESIELSGEELAIKQVLPEWLRFTGEVRFDTWLDTRVTAELRQEGYARELKKAIQNLRKDSGFQVSDRIVVGLSDRGAVGELLTQYGEMIRREVLADTLDGGDFEPEGKATLELGEAQIEITVRRVSY